MMLLALLALNLRGAAFDGSTLVTWGDEIRAWVLPKLTSRVLAKPPAQVGEGGCLDDSGRALFLQEGDRLVYRQAPHWGPQVLDHGIDMHDCVAATLLGHRGVLMVQRGMQVRFYEYPDFHYTEIYSFYSASKQAGLVVTDIDGDGRPDIICGNYWIRSPERFDLAWHDFAIELYNQEPSSATLRLAFDRDDLVVAQGEIENGRVARFKKPVNPREQWKETETRTMRYPHALGISAAGLLVGENAGKDSRLFLDGLEIGKTDGLIAAFAYAHGFILVGHNQVSLRR